MAAATRPPSLIELDPVSLLRDDEQALAEPRTELCARCQNFDIQSFKLTSDRTRGYLLSEVQEAARDGCTFCTLLLDSVCTLPRPRDTTETEPNFLRLPVNNSPDMYVHMTVSQDYGPPEPGVNRLRTAIADRFSDVRSASDHELCLAADMDSPAAVEVTGRYLGPDPSSGEHYDAVRAWIDACKEHPRCNQTVSGQVAIDARQSPLPARCIEISSVAGELRARLATTDGMQGTYITLTHRWNLETEACKTTTTNYGDKQRGIDLDAVPNVFSDALTIASELKVPYVWIDSICIIQDGDNGADWRREAPKMAQYYQFSLLTLAGTTEDTTHGLLRPCNDMPWARLVQIPYTDKSGTRPGRFFAYKRRVPLADDYWAAVRESILFRRGWILQEWLLSKRILWYTSKGMFFECQTDGARSEYGERVLVDNAHRSQLQLKGSFHFASASILDVWYAAIEVYSSCHLTKPEQDRILAVAGLAKEVGLILANRKCEVYLGGHWLRDIHQSLLWEEEHEAAPWARKVDRAPSWSWASIMTPMKWPARDKDPKKAVQIVGLCHTRRDSRHQMECVVDKGWTASISGRKVEFDPTNISACLHARGKLHTPQTHANGEPYAPPVDQR
ncbi:heterokaryon incompatibility protein-domain-containing protein [Coniochaeta sp. 2T2.1]|nr:heterokaryon incompatibility protein-domain-containing protein [Coniochaeta sp. 2T2.1]